MSPVARKTAPTRRPKTPALSWDVVREMGLALPGAEASTAYGTPALKVRGRMFACIPTNRAAEPESLVVCVPFDQRAELLEAEPDIYYLKEHYENYACVLVRLRRVHPDALRDLLRGAHQFIMSKAKRMRPRPRRG